jgi:hypothetical protein
MPGTRTRAVALALALMLAAAPARASDDVRRRGSCSGGPGDWTLRARRDDGALRLRFKIDDVPAGQSWQLFMSDNGTRIYSGTKTSDPGGEVRVSKRTTNRAGSDRIVASGVNTKTGTTCEGSLTY